MNRLTKYMLLASSLLVATSSQAELFRMGPLDTPAPPGNGYPTWYQDTNGLALDLCVPATVDQLDACTVVAAPGQPLPTLPFSFPNNWLDEFFWYGADAVLPLPGVGDAILVEAVEAAFALGGPAVGDQITFSRIRIRFDAPTAGTYTVTYPYGQEVFPDVAAGELVFYTSDVGIGAPGDFSGALQGAIGPYLTPVANNGGLITPTDPIIIGGDTFLTDGITPTLATGSPFNTNYFEICVENATNSLDGQVGSPACLSTEDFIVFGKVHTAPINSPLSIARATYSTHLDAAGIPMNMAHIDVFASAEPGPLELTPDLTVGVPNAPSAHMIGPRNPGGLYYGQAVVPLTSLPNSVTVINSADTPPSAKVAGLSDAITISEATYDASTRVVSIVAMSSDMAAPPILTAVGIPGSVTGSDELFGGSLTRTLALGTVPPQFVTVISSKGGRAVETVTMPAHDVAFPPGAPLAVDDNVITGESAAAAIFNLIANDGPEAVPASLTMFSQPAHASIILNNLDGTVSYTPTAGYFGVDSFKYTVSSIDGLSSNIATVNINVQQINDAPVANNDLAASPGLTAEIIVDVVANDTDLDGFAPAPGGLDPSTVTVIDVIGFSAFANGDGTVTYAKDAACEAASTCGFTYTVSDLGGLTSGIASVEVSTAGNLAPTANADAASVLESQSVTFNVATNDNDADGTLDLTSVTITTAPTSGTVNSIGNGLVTYNAAAGARQVTFGYTINDNLGAPSNEAIVTVTVNPNPDNLAVQRASCRAGKNEWRVDGTSSILAVHTVTVHEGATLGGAVIGSYAVDNLGSWRMSKNNTSNRCVSFISIESNLGGELLAVPVSGN